MKVDKKALIRWKVHIDRSRMYIGYIQFLMIFIVLLKAYPGTWVYRLVFDNVWISFPVIIVLFMVGCVVLGYLDKLMGLREKENEVLTEFNPYIMKMMKQLDELTKDKENEKHH